MVRCCSPLAAGDDHTQTILTQHKQHMPRPEKRQESKDVYHLQQALSEVHRQLAHKPSVACKMSNESTG